MDFQNDFPTIWFCLPEKKEKMIMIIILIERIKLYESKFGLKV